MHVSLSEVEAAVAKAAMAVGLPPGLGEDAGRAARLMLRTGLGALSDLVGALDAVDGGASVGFDADRAPAGMLVPANGARQLSALRAGPTACDLLLAAAGPTGGDGRDTGAPTGRSGDGDRVPPVGGGAGSTGSAVTPAAVDAVRRRGVRGSATLDRGTSGEDVAHTARRRDVRGPGSRNVVALAAVDYPTIVLHQVIDVSRSTGAPLLVAWPAPGTACPAGTRAPCPQSNAGAPLPAAWPDGGGARVEVVCRNGAAYVRSGGPAAVSGHGPAEMSLGLVEALSGQEAGRGAGMFGGDGAGAEVEDAVWRRLCAHAARWLVEGTERSRLAGAGAGVADTD